MKSEHGALYVNADLVESISSSYNSGPIGQQVEVR